MRARALELLPRAIEHDLANGDAGNLFDSLANAVGQCMDPRHPLFAELVRRALEARITQGIGRGQSDEAFAGVAETAVGTLMSAGVRVADLWLLVAAYHAHYDNGGERRRRSIRKAVESSQDALERLRAELILAKFHIDTSEYRAAHSVLDGCENLMRRSRDTDRYRADLHCSRAMSYFYADSGRAEELFRQAIQEAEPYRDDPDVAQSAAQAHHYLGRLAYSRGEFGEAIEQYLEAQELSTGRLTGRGFHHLRIAEILIEYGEQDEAYYHLNECAYFFRRVYQVSNGEAQLDHASARWELKAGRPDKAFELLESALGKAAGTSFSRGVIQYSFELARLHLSHRRPFRAFRLLWRAAVTLLVTELIENGRPAFGKIRTILTLVPHIGVVPRRSRPRPQVACTCGADHVRPRVWT
ncbi:tetratricopeptide repeat protein [Actinomadura napierensis]|uniref:Tetratricopeptide repeat protein n=1 Tax=Actinomadura napierensis TaxID=267854 RepID=A0ABN3A707_9ACTN